MKFRCKISNEGVKILLALVVTISKIHDEATVLLSDDYLRFVIISNQLIENPRIYIELSSALLCSEYRIESQHAQNSIIFDINLNIFAKALSSGKFSTHSIFKLTKKDNKPYFTMECKASESLLSLDLVHDLPIQLVRVYDFSLYVPPTTSKPPISFTLPKNRILKTLVERLTKINKVIFLIAQTYGSNKKTIEGVESGPGSIENRGVARYGQLKIQADNYNVKVQSFVNNLLIPTGGDVVADENGPTTDKQPVVISVYSKKLSVVLDYHNIPHQEASIYLIPNEALMLHVELSPLGLGSISYSLPVLVNEDSLLTASATEVARPTSSSSSSRKKSPEKGHRVNKDDSKGGKKNQQGSGYENVNIEEIKRIVERESLSRRKIGQNNSNGGGDKGINDEDDQDEENEEDEGAGDDSDDDFLWKDNRILKDQYKQPYSRATNRESARTKALDDDHDDDSTQAEERYEEEDDEDDESVQPKKGLLGHSISSTSKAGKRNFAKSFLFSD